MKKILVMVLALGFMVSTTGLVLAQGTTGTPAKKSHKKHHPKKKAAAVSSAPVSSTAPAK